MDNFTHSLIGAALAETAHSMAPNPTPKRRRWFLWTSLVANNFPDLDFLYSWITPGTIGYLVHHRGHTHTLVAVLPQALLCLGAVWAVAKWRRTPLSPVEWRWLGGLTVVGLCVHILADWMNFYGVHPFWPFDNRWYYGDSVFIIEPVLWVGLAGLLARSVPSRLLRVALFLPALGISVFGLSLGYLWWTSATAIAVVGAATYWAGGRLGEQQRGPAAVVLGGGFVLLSVLLSQVAERRVAQLIQNQLPHHQPLEWAMDPLPANLLCWGYLAVLKTEEAMEAEAGVVSLLPSWIPSRACPRKERPGTGTTLAPSQLTESAALSPIGVYRLPLPQFQSLVLDNCRVRAFLRFARVPQLYAEEITDLRFSMIQKSNFTSVGLAGDCPNYIPNWTPPRADILPR